MRYEGLDISLHHIEKARQRYPDTTFHQGDALKIDFADASLNVVLAVDVLLHNWEVERLLREWYRVTRHCLIVTTRTINTRPSLRAFQPTESGELAPYHILNTGQLTQMCASLNPDYIVGVPSDGGFANVFGLPSDLKQQEVKSHCFFILKDLPKEADSFIRRDAPTGAS